MVIPIQLPIQQKPISNFEIKDYLTKLKNVTPVQIYIKLSDSEIKKLLDTRPGWTANNNKLHKTIEFGDFPTMFSFIFKIAETAMIINHHPNVTSTFTTVTIDADTWNLGHVISNQDEKLARDSILRIMQQSRSTLNPIIAINKSLL